MSHTSVLQSSSEWVFSDLSDLGWPVLSFIILNHRMSGHKDLLDFKYNANTPGVDQLLGQSDPEDEAMEQDNEVVFVEEC